MTQKNNDDTKKKIINNKTNVIKCFSYFTQNA